MAASSLTLKPNGARWNACVAVQYCWATAPRSGMTGPTSAAVGRTSLSAMQPATRAAHNITAHRATFLGRSPILPIPAAPRRVRVLKG